MKSKTFADYAAMIEMRHLRIRKGFCFVDGLKLPVAQSFDENTQNACYNGWACGHYCSSVLAFAPDDTAFPHKYNRIKNRIRNAFKKNSRLPARLQEQGRLDEYVEVMAGNDELVSAREAAEWGM
ncbi:hypothetical protein PHMEG_00010928 [Phytophthora megakarya]|uniref:Uncharacterized protein n=1 Tax=Phytophthora megakarya TaxID=4795 RepID=A0A225WCG0_9STRA|nr:hypothetical protein PHMEG_00010928 [Phytophthora megakarya]